MTAERRLEFITLLFGNDSLRAGHADLFDLYDTAVQAIRRPA